MIYWVKKKPETESRNKFKEQRTSWENQIFSLKFVVYSGAKPCDMASSDGESVKILGYKWMTEADLLSPGLGELNLNKKIRGMKKKN